MSKHRLRSEMLCSSGLRTGVRPPSAPPPNNADFDTKSALLLFAHKALKTRCSPDDAVSALGAQRHLLRAQILKMRSIKKRNPRSVSLLAIFSIFSPLRFFIRFFVSLLILPFLYRLPFPRVWEFGQRKKRHYAAGILLLTLFALTHNSNLWNSILNSGCRK